MIKKITEIKKINTNEEFKRKTYRNMNKKKNFHSSSEGRSSACVMVSL